MSSSHPTPIRKAAAWAMADQYASFAIAFAASIILARFFISPEQLGLFSIAFAAVSLLAFLQDFGTVRYISGEPDLSPEKLRASYTLSLTVGWTIALLCTGLAWPLAAFYDDPRLLPITLVIAGSYFLFPLAVVPQALRHRAMDFRSTAIIGISSALANAAVSLYLGWKGHGPLALAWGTLAQQGVRALVAQWRSGWVSPWPPRFGNMRTLLSFGGTNTALVVCMMVVARAPELFIGRLLGAAPVGLFARATGLAVQLQMLLSGAVSAVFYPAFAKVRDRDEPLGPPYLKVVAAYSAITWPAMAGLAVLAEPTINLLYGPRWVEAAPLLVWIALSQMCFIAFPLTADMPILLGHRAELIRRTIADAVIAVGLLVLAAPYGLEAVAASRLVHGLLWLGSFGPFLQRIVGFGWAAHLAILGKSALATLAAVLPASLLYSVWDGPATAGFLQILCAAGGGVLCWLMTLALLRHPTFAEIPHLAAPVLARIGLSRLLPAPRA